MGWKREDRTKGPNFMSSHGKQTEEDTAFILDGQRGSANITVGIHSDIFEHLLHTTAQLRKSTNQKRSPRRNVGDSGVNGQLRHCSRAAGLRTGRGCQVTEQAEGGGSGPAS